MNVALRKADGTKVGSIATTVDVQRPSTSYLVSPHKGRVGKSREVAPQIVIVERKPHDMDAIGKAITSAFHKYYKRYDAWSVFDRVEHADNRYTFKLYCNGVENHLATFTVETIEE